MRRRRGGGIPFSVRNGRTNGMTEAAPHSAAAGKPVGVIHPAAAPQASGAIERGGERHDEEVVARARWRENQSEKAAEKGIIVGREKRRVDCGERETKEGRKEGRRVDSLVAWMDELSVREGGREDAITMPAVCAVRNGLARQTVSQSESD